MNLTTYYTGAPKHHTLRDELWPGDLEKQARVAVGLWLGCSPDRPGFEWTGAIIDITSIGDRVKVNVAGPQTFDFVATNVAGPW